MGFVFAETMSGTVVWDSEPGKKHPFKFEISAHAESTRAHFLDGKVSVRGVLDAPPRAHGVDCEGTMTIRPIGQKIIRYELSFVGDDGKPYELVGQKDIRFLSLRKTLTYLPAEILDDQHRRVATCETRFDVKNDLWSFLRSWKPA
ncbi:MAG: hypothetical protein AB7T06_34310 [Kofleriaceae bacterium]